MSNDIQAAPSFASRVATNRQSGQAANIKENNLDPVDSFISSVTGANKQKADHHHDDHHHHHGGC